MFNRLEFYLDPNEGDGIFFREIAEKIFTAFGNFFPSVPGTDSLEDRQWWSHILVLAKDGELDPETAKWQRAHMLEYSNDGEWPCKVVITVQTEMELGKKAYSSTMVHVVPYCGDRALSIQYMPPSITSEQYRFVIDYTERPSTNHADVWRGIYDKLVAAYGTLPKHGRPRPVFEE